MPLELSEEHRQILIQCFKESCGDDERLLEVYIPPMGGVQAHSTREQQYPLLNHLPTMIHTTPYRSFVIFGDSGLGKTTLSLKLCEFFWENIAIYQRIPFYVYLPSILTEGRLPHDILKDFLGQRALEHLRASIRHQPLLFILDGYDEISDRRNLFTLNQWFKQYGYDVKVIVCCRAEVLRDQNIAALFEVVDDALLNEPARYKICHLQSFNDAQIRDYLQAFVRHLPKDMLEDYFGTRWVVDESPYMEWLERLPTLKKLAETPFLLTLIAQSLPSIAENHSHEEVVMQSHLTQTDVFEVFVNRWFSKQAKRLHDGHRLLALDHNSLCVYLKSYAQNLAASLISHDGLLRTDFLTDAETLIPKLAEPAHYPTMLRIYEQRYRAFFEVRENLRSLRDGCLLRAQGHRFQFLHKSLVEFLAARELFAGLQGEYDAYLQDIAPVFGAGALNRQLIKDIQMMTKLVERIQANEDFKQLLFRIIESSKDTPGLSTMAANAITLLNAAQINFSGCDFSDIQIPGADLRYALCKGTDFRGANLSDVSFNGACLENARWNGANCFNISFGEQAYLQHPNIISTVENRVNAVSFYQSSEASYWIAGCADGYAYQWDSETHKLFRTYKHNEGFILARTIEITSLAIENAGHLLITGRGALKHDIWLWSLQTGNWLKKLEGNSGNIESLAISYSGALLASRNTYPNNTILLWHLPNGTLKQSLYSSHILADITARSMCFSPVGDLFAAVANNKIQLWNLPDGEKGPLFGENIHRISFSSDGSQLIASGGGSCYLWKTSNITVEPMLLLSDGSSADCFSPHGKWSAGCNGGGNRHSDEDFCIILVDLQDRENQVVFRGHKNHIKDLAFHPQLNWIASGSSDGTVRIWRIPNGLEKSFVNAGSHRKPLTLNRLDIHQTIALPNMAQRLCEQQGAIGKPAHAEQPYTAWCSLFQPIPGTASIRHHSLLKKGAEHLSVSGTEWVVSVARKRSIEREDSTMSIFNFWSKLSDSISLKSASSQDASFHTFLLIEGIKNHRRFIIRAELTSPDRRSVIIELKSLCGQDTKKDITEFMASAASYECQQWGITSEKGETLLRNIRDDQQRTIAYNQFGGSLSEDYHSCVSWCKKQLRQILEPDVLLGSDVLRDRWYNFVIEYPFDLVPMSDSVASQLR